jgi:hypothetical protein
MKVKELIKKLQEYNPLADVECGFSEHCDPNIPIIDIESNHPTIVIIILAD